VAVLPAAKPVHKVSCLHAALLLNDPWAFTAVMLEGLFLLAAGDTTKRADEDGNQAHLVAVVGKEIVQRGTGW
jgi:hypothetical protein